jgi:hypothetical protein
MTDIQLYLAIGVPIVANAAMMLFGFGLMLHHMDKRLDDLKEVWRSELRRVEEVVDARLKHLEER